MVGETFTPRQQFDRLIGPLRESAREHGYALAVHGSINRDIDLIAVPWVPDAADAPVVAEALRAVAETITGRAATGWKLHAPAEFTLAGCPGDKPHGRLGWAFTLGGGSYIDLAVFPPTSGTADDVRAVLRGGGG